MVLNAKPATGLGNELKLEVVDPHGGKVAFREIEDFVTGRWPLAGNHVHLVITVKMVLVSPVANLFALEQLIFDVRVASGGNEGRQPVETGDDLGVDRISGHMAGPANHRGCAETAFIAGAFASVIRGFAAIRPSEALRTVVARSEERRVGK